MPWIKTKPEVLRARQFSAGLSTTCFFLLCVTSLGFKEIISVVWNLVLSLQTKSSLLTNTLELFLEALCVAHSAQQTSDCLRSTMARVCRGVTICGLLAFSAHHLNLSEFTKSKHICLLLY